jgi:hypothetical protein
LPIRILRIKLNATIFGDECLNMRGKSLTQRPPPNPSAAGVSYRIKFRLSFFSGQFLHIRDRGRLVQVLTEYRDVDVFRKAADEIVVLRQRCAAFEEKAWAPLWKPVIENIERPANPEILLDILHRCTKSARCGEKNIEAVRR